jgi:hypothetical protein
MNIQEYIDYKVWCDKCGLKPHFAKVLSLYIAIMNLGKEIKHANI